MPKNRQKVEKTSEGYRNWRKDNNIETQKNQKKGIHHMNREGSEEDTGLGDEDE